jgi:hypothetical protein
LDIDDAIGNSDSSLNNKVYLSYVDCVLGNTEKEYTFDGYYTNDVCSKASGGLYYYKSNKKIQTGEVYEEECCEGLS